MAATSLCIVGSAALAVAGVGAMAPSALATTAATGHGSTGITVSLPSAGVANPGAAPVEADLGSFSLDASSTPALESSISVSGQSVLGQSVPGKTITSADGRQAGNYSVPMSAAGVDGTLTLASYLVDAANGTATSSLGGLTGKLTASALGVSASLGQHALSSVVTPTKSASDVEVVTPGLNVTLGNVLPSSVLGNLPLGTVLSLVDSLKLSLPSNLSSEVATLNSVVTQLAQLSTDLGQLQTAQGQLSSLESSSGSAAITAAQQAVASDQATVAADQQKVSSDQTTISSLQSQIAALPAGSSLLSGLQSQLSSAQATLSTDEASLAAAQSQLAADQATLSNLVSQASANNAALAAAQSAVTTLTDEITSLENTVTSTLGSLTNLTALLDSLRNAVAGAPLVDVGQVAFDLAASADAQSGVANIACSVGSTSVLGQAIPGSVLPGGASAPCGTLVSDLSSIQSTVAGVLASLPVKAAPAVSVSGMTPTTSASPHPDANRTTTASAGISALKVDVSPVQLVGIVDSLVSKIQGEVTQLTGVTGSQLSLVAGGWKASAMRFAGPMNASSILPSLGPLPAPLSSALSTLTSQLNSLPTGQALAGLGTTGLQAGLVGLSTTASFQANPAQSAGSTPGQSAPSPKTSGPSLPFTGSNPAPLVALGMLALAGGAYLLRASRTSAARVPVSAMPVAVRPQPTRGQATGR